MQIVLYLVMLVVFFGVMIAVGFVCRRKSRTSQGFMLGGRSVGPWLTAFAYGTSYFSAVVFVGYAGQFGWKFGVSSTWIMCVSGAFASRRTCRNIRISCTRRISGRARCRRICRGR